MAQASDGMAQANCALPSASTAWAASRSRSLPRNKLVVGGSGWDRPREPSGAGSAPDMQVHPGCCACRSARGTYPANPLQRATRAGRSAEYGPPRGAFVTNDPQSGPYQQLQVPTVSHSTWRLAFPKLGSVKQAGTTPDGAAQCRPATCQLLSPASEKPPWEGEAPAEPRSARGAARFSRMAPGADCRAVSPGAPVRAQDRAGYLGSPGGLGMAPWQSCAGRRHHRGGKAVHRRALSRLLVLGKSLEGPGGASWALRRRTWTLISTPSSGRSWPRHKALALRDAFTDIEPRGRCQLPQTFKGVRQRRPNDTRDETMSCCFSGAIVAAAGHAVDTEHP
jgi:hypothetical protein